MKVRSGLVAAGVFAISAQVLANPNVVVWGDNSLGQTNVPATLTNAVSIAAGYNHMLAVTADGKVVRWGGGKPPEVLPGSGYVAVVAGDRALRADGTVWNLGNVGFPRATQIAGLSNIVQIANGGDFSWALDSKGKVYWVTTGLGNPPLFELERIVQVFGMQGAALAVNADGEMRGWSSLGMNPPTPMPSQAGVLVAVGVRPHEPTIVLNGEGQNIANPPAYQQYLSAPTVALDGVNRDLALAPDGSLFTMSWTQPPTGSAHPALSNVAQIASGYAHNAALLGRGAPVFFPQVVERQVTIGMPMNIYSPAFGERPISYEWSVNGAVLDNQTNAWLHLPTFESDDAGTYQVRAQNAHGSSARSFQIAALPLSVLTPPTNKIALLGMDAALAIHARGLNLQYQWERDGVEIAGATNAELKFPSFKWEDEGIYRVRVWNEDSSLVSPEAGLRGTGIGFVQALTEWVLARAGASNVVQLAFAGALNPDGQIFEAGLGGSLYGDLVSTNIVWIEPGAAISGSGQLEYPAGTFPGNLMDVIKIQGGLALRADGTLAPYRSDIGTNLPPLADVIDFSVADTSVALHGDGTVTAWNLAGREPVNLPIGLSNVVGIASVFDVFSSFSAVMLNLTNDEMRIYGSHGDRIYEPLGFKVLEVDPWGTALLENGRMTNIFGPPLERSIEGITDIFRIESRGDYMVAIGEGAPHFWPARTNRTGSFGKPMFLLGRAAGRMPIRYQWRLGGSDLAGQTNRFLAVHENGMKSGVYELVATNAEGARTLAYRVEIAFDRISLERRADGRWVIFKPGDGGSHTLVQSADLRTWTAMPTSVLQTNGGFEFDLPPATTGHRFYRVLTE